MKQETSKPDQPKEQQELVPISFNVKGSIPNSIARVLGAICCLIEEVADFLIDKIRSSRK
jgi:hypothetical protein